MKYASTAAYLKKFLEDKNHWNTTNSSLADILATRGAKASTAMIPA